jgi:capsular polysaccharide biosynthesis protein
MNVKKFLLLRNEVVKRNKINLHDTKDEILFNKDYNKKLSEVYYFKIKYGILNSDGPIISPSIIFDYLGFKSLSGNILFKKILLLINFFIYQIFNLNKKIINLDDELFIVHNRNSIGYFHWISDILPKLVFLKKKFKKKIIKICLPENLNVNFVLSSLNILGIKYVLISKKYNYKIKNAFYIPEIYPSGNPRPKKILDLKKNFSKYLLKKNNNLVYISRDKSGRRRLENDYDFRNVLKKYGFKTYFMEKLSLKNQIRICSSAKVLIGLHGAGLVNSIWMSKGSHLIELRPEKNIYANCFYSICSINKINYDYFLCNKSNKFKNTTYANYRVNIDNFNHIFKSKLEKIISDMNV